MWVVVLPALVCSAAPARAWAPGTQLAIAESALQIAPPDLRRLIERHIDRFREGVRAPFELREASRHEKNADGSGDLDAIILQETEWAIEAIRLHEPFADVVYRLGSLSHYVADANNPLNTSSSDPAERRYGVDYLRYVESARPRFTRVFYGSLDGGSDLAGMLAAAFQRGRDNYPSIGREYERIGEIDGVRLFDDRSTAFGVAAVSYSHAISDVARILRHVWLEAGGADPRSLSHSASRPIQPRRASTP